MVFAPDMLDHIIAHHHLVLVSELSVDFRVFLLHVLPVSLDVELDLWLEGIVLLVGVKLALELLLEVLLSGSEHGHELLH